MAGKLTPIFSSALIATASVAILALYTGDSWLAPKSPLIIGAAIALPLSLFGVLLLHPEARSAPSHFLPLSLVAALLGAGVPALWMLPEARKAAIVEATSFVDVYKALDDPDVDVQHQACVQLFVDADNVNDITDALVDRPRLANRCLTALAEDSDARTVSTNLAGRWHDRLVSDRPAPASNQCLHAQALGALPIERGEKQGDLLDCALRSASKPKQLCCAQSLAEIAESCDALARHFDARRLIGTEAASTLMALSFGESTARREMGAVAKRLPLGCESMKMIGVQLACASLSKRHAAGVPGAESAETVLGWLLDEHTGCLDPTQRTLEATPGEVCPALMETIRRKKSVDAESVCDSHRRVIVERQQIVEDLRGLSAEESAELAFDISSGAATRDRQKTTIAEFLASAQGKPGAAALDSYTEADKREMIERVRAGLGSPDEIVGGALGTMAEAKEAYDSKLAGTAKVAELREENPELPSGEDAEAQFEKSKEKLGDAHERFQNESAKAKREAEPRP